MIKKTLIAAATVGLMSTAAVASTLSGEFWDAPGNSIANINDGIAYATSNAATATFTSTAINYGDSTTNWDIGTTANFLQADSGSLNPAAAGALYFQESVLRLSGQVSINTGDIVTVTSDDGFRLIINGVQLNPGIDNAGINCGSDEGIRPPGCTNNMEWMGPSGTYAATLWYIEGNESQAQLISNLGAYATPVPIPAAGFLLIGALGGLAALKRRKKAA